MKKGRLNQHILQYRENFFPNIHQMLKTLSRKNRHFRHQGRENISEYPDTFLKAFADVIEEFPLSEDPIENLKVQFEKQLKTMFEQKTSSRTFGATHFFTKIKVEFNNIVKEYGKINF